MAINKVYEVGPDRIRVEKTSGNETSVVLSVNPDELLIMDKEEFGEVVQAVNELMGWSNDRPGGQGAEYRVGTLAEALSNFDHDEDLAFYVTTTGGVKYCKISWIGSPGDVSHCEIGLEEQEGDYERASDFLEGDME